MTYKEQGIIDTEIMPYKEQSIIDTEIKSYKEQSIIDTEIKSSVTVVLDEVHKLAAFRN